MNMLRTSLRLLCPARASLFCGSGLMAATNKQPYYGQGQIRRTAASSADQQPGMRRNSLRSLLPTQVSPVLWERPNGRDCFCPGRVGPDGYCQRKPRTKTENLLQGSPHSAPLMASGNSGQRGARVIIRRNFSNPSGSLDIGRLHICPARSSSRSG